MPAWNCCSNYGQKAIGARVLEITDLACRRLTAAGAIIDSFRSGDRRSGIVSFRLPGRDPDALRSSVSSGRSCSVAGQGDCGSVRTPIMMNPTSTG